MARTPQREDRRRRVLREESRPTKKKIRRRSSSERAYSQRALEANQPRVTDCLPQRYRSLFFLFVAGIAAIGVVQALHIAREKYLEQYPMVDTTWLSLSGPMTLSSALAAGMLALTALLAMLIFHIRQHKVDDYKGRYRMWYVVIILLLAGSLDAITLAHRGVPGLAAMFLKNLPWKNPAVGWILAWSVLGGLVGLRAMIEVRRSFGTLFCWLLSVACFAGAAVLYLRLYDFVPEDYHLAARTALFLGGIHFLLFGTAVYARFVYMQAQGIKKTRKPVKAKTAESEATDDEPRTGLFRLPKFGRGKNRRKVSKETADETEYEEEAHEDDEPTEEELELLTNPDLTRSERKKLKKQLRQRRRAA